MDFRKEFLVKPGRKLTLSNFDAGYHGKHESEKHAAEDLDHYRDKISKLQRTLYGDGSKALLVVLQGIDGAGKDGTCWHVISAMDPQGVHVTGFKQPTPTELGHDFLWRVHAHAPRRGEIAIFNRSHYEDVLFVRVHNLVPAHTWEARYEFINNWERLLHVENHTTIIKLFLYISKERQLERFKQRLDDPGRQWKISKNDYSEREYWDDYITAFEGALNNCSTSYAPWYVIPANHKWFRNLAVSQIIADTLEEMNPIWPKPTVDINEIRRLYHSAEEQQSPTKK